MTPAGEANPVTRLAKIIRTLPIGAIEPIGLILVEIFQTPDGPAQRGRAYTELMESACRAHAYVDAYAHEMAKGEWLKPFTHILNVLEQHAGPSPTQNILAAVHGHIPTIEAIGFSLPCSEVNSLADVESVQDLIELLTELIAETEQADLPINVKRYTVLLLHRLITDLRQYIYVGEERLQQDLQSLIGQMAMVSRAGHAGNPKNANWWEKVSKAVVQTELLLSIYANATQALPSIGKLLKELVEK